MVISFSWRVFGGRAKPIASYAGPTSGPSEPLPCLLVDDGGLDVGTTLRWIDEGIALVRGASLASGAQSWDRETWGAKIAPRSVVIYSLHDESVSEEVSTDAFLEVLTQWRVFITAGPDGCPIRRIELHA
jgi:hypothetical protein